MSAYETAEEHLERAITEASFSDLESAIVRGIAAIESFLSGQISIWNRAHPGEKMIDSRDTKVSFDDKIDKWIPIMTGGSRLNKSKHWGYFKRLRGIRDNYTIHPKAHGITLSYTDLAELINLFGKGVAGVLIDLHIVFRNWVPSPIIRGYNAPKVQVVKL